MSPLFRKKPVVVEARQWTSPAQAWDLVEWAGDQTLSYNGLIPGPPGPDGEDWGQLRVLTLEGEHFASPRDYLITGVQGEFYFCKPDIFEASYERTEPVRCRACTMGHPLECEAPEHCGRPR